MRPRIWLIGAHPVQLDKVEKNSIELLMVFPPDWSFRIEEYEYFSISSFYILPVFRYFTVLTLDWKCKLMTAKLFYRGSAQSAGGTPSLASQYSVKSEGNISELLPQFEEMIVNSLSVKERKGHS